MSDTIYDKGMATRRAVLGNDYVQGALDRATDFTRPLQLFLAVQSCQVGRYWPRRSINTPMRCH